MDPKIISVLLQETRDLKGKREEIRSRLNFLDKKYPENPSKKAPKEWHECHKQALKEWLADADHFLGRSDDFMMTTAGAWLLKRMERLNISKRELIETLEQANEMVKQAKKLSIEATFVVPDLRMENPSSSDPDHLGALWQHFNERSVAKIGICGFMRSEKTTLLKSFYSKVVDLKIFHSHMFVTVSQKFDIRSVQKQILDSLCLPRNKDESIEIQATTIFTSLTGHRYLLALDDVWEGLDLEAIGIPNPTSENKCKVLFTTKSKEVGVIMEAQRMITMDPSSMKTAWDLFCKHAGDKVSLQPEITVIAEEIFLMYEDSPSALVTIGRAVVKLGEEGHWQYVLDSLKESVRKIGSQNAYFRIPYEVLGSQGLKDCLLYCSLFPKDYSISRELLVHYWIGEGIMIEYLESEVTHDIGHYIIDHLIDQAYMLQKGNNNPELEVRIDDPLRDFALKTMGNRFLVEADKLRTTRWREWQKVERVFLMNCNIKSLDEVPYCPRLLTLILRENSRLRKISDNIFQSHDLRVLDLSHTGISEIPPSIGNLVELGYLDLSFTNIKSLPKEVRQLVKLKYLGLESTTFLTEVPGNILSELSNVMVLNMFDSYGNWEVNECQGKESRASMEELEMLASGELLDFGITICNTPAWRWFFSSSSYLTGLTQKLILKNCEDLETFHLSSFLSNIRNLTVSDCYILKEFIIETENLSLEVLQLMGLFRTQILFGNGVVAGDCLLMLREITIGSCYELRDITWASQLENLEHLNLYCCKKIESVIEDDANEGGHERSEAFQKLKSMTLHMLPSLKRICEGTLKFPCLEFLKVLQCPQLTALPLRTESAEKSMNMIYGEREWWKDLKWKDKSVEIKFHEYFQAE